MKFGGIAIIGLIGSLICGLSALTAGATGRDHRPQFESCDPVTEFSFDTHRAGNVPNDLALPRLDFCAEWNPEFVHNGGHCCGKFTFSRRQNKRLRCAPNRFSGGGYCAERTAEQAQYEKDVASGKIPDALEAIIWDVGRKGNQAWCTVNNGFLAWGRPIVATEKNRVLLRSPDRCTHYGTDGMIGMIEWTGRQLAKEYKGPEFEGLRLIVGDISAPRGGCLVGRSGRKGHASHTSGQDVDLGLLLPKSRMSTVQTFHKTFDPKANWWLLKQLFHNPFACVKVVFLDRSHIHKLAKYMSKIPDPEWSTLRRFIRHVPGHKNHHHVRIGEGPGLPGCTSDARPELETEENGGVDDGELDLEKDLLPSGG